MALDTPEKRASSLNFSMVGGNYVLPIPTGTIGAAQRAHLLGLYSGFAAPTSATALVSRISTSIGISIG